ncbi:glycosyltransferase family 4 protein, partial [Pasteurellaceae bacterium Phil31]
MKNIVFFVGNLNNSGGTERVSTDIANLLLENGYRITFINLWAGDTPFFPLDENIKVLSLNQTRESFKKTYFSNVLKLRKIIKECRFDILIDVESMLSLYSIPALINLKVRHVCWEHFNFKINLGKRTRDLSRQLAGIFVDDIITLTERDKHFWKKGLIWQRANIIAIPNPSTFKPQDLHPELNNKTFLAVGRLTYQKGFDLLLEAWKEALPVLTANGWKLRIVGDGEDKKNLLEFIQNNNLSSSVTIENSTDKIKDFYAKASFYVMSSRFEGFGLVLIEAQAFGLPIISFDCDVGPREILEEGKTGWLCKVGDYKCLANILFQAANMKKEKYDNMSMNAKEN